MKPQADIQVVPAELLAALADQAGNAAEPGASQEGSHHANGQANKHVSGIPRLRVADWLNDRGIDFRVKDQPESSGRTVYVLRECPFDPAHGDPDSCIMQAPDGHLSAKCLHNSCREKGWQEFKKKIGPPTREHFDGISGKRRGRRKKSRGAQAAVGDVPRSDDDRVTIEITTREHEVNAQAAEAIGNDPGVFQRGGVLVRIVRDSSPAACGIRRPVSPRIDPLPLPLLRERLTATARWVTTDDDFEIETRPPAWCVAAVHNHGHWPAVRHLEAVIDHPVLRPDGTILDQPGYDASTGLLLETDETSCTVGSTREEAVKAIRDLLEVVEDFPLEAESHKSAWLAALLTPLARFAFRGNAPLFLVDANVRAAGKGLLLDCISQIIFGRRFTIATYTNDEEELRKRITSLAVAGDRMVGFDNLTTTFGNGTLDAALTASSWEDRLLGGNRIVRAPLFITWFATGNNVVIAADTARRICHMRLESPEEKPEERRDFRHADLLSWVGENRQRLLAAALTILRAYIVAGRPDQNLPAWGSFEGWSGLVRAALVWAGMPDPAETRLRLQERADVVAEGMEVLLLAWERMDPERKGLTAAEVVHRVFAKPDRNAPPPPDAYSEMRDAIENLVGRADARALGYKLRSYRRRIFLGRYFDHTDRTHKTIRWAVFSADSFSRRQETSPPSPPSPPSDQANIGPDGGDGGDGGDVSPTADPDSQEGGGFDHGDAWEGDGP